MRLVIALLVSLCSSAYALAAQVVDQSGRTVELPEKVDHVVAIPIPLASMIMAVDGGPQRLSGMNIASRADFEFGLLGRMFPEATEVPSQVAGEGFVPNVEALAATGAQLVFQWGDRGDGIINPISALGIPVITVLYGDSSHASGWLRLVGAGLGKAERGNALADWFEQRSRDIAEHASQVPDDQRPRVLYLQRSRSGLIAAGKGSSVDGDIRMANGINVAEGVPGFAPVDVEQLLVWDPEVILLNNFEPGLLPSEFYQDTRLSTLSAVREKRVYSYPHGGFRWDPPSQESPLALDWLASVFHPEHAQPGLRERIREAYQLLYGYDVTDEDLDHLLKIKGQGDSAHYLRLFSKDAP